MYKFKEKIQCTELRSHGSSSSSSRTIHGSKFAVHFSGSWMAMPRSTPEIGGPFTSTHRQGCPNALMEAQQASVGGMGLNGATADRQGMSWTRAEKNVLPHGCPLLSCTNAAAITTTIIKQDKAESFFILLVMLLFLIGIVSDAMRVYIRARGDMLFVLLS